MVNNDMNVKHQPIITKNKIKPSLGIREESGIINKNKFQTRFIQINLKKKINANKTMLSEIKENDIILIQEPYINKNGYIPDVPKSHKQLMVTKNSKEIRRSAILIPIEMAKCTMMLNGLSNKDITTLICEINKNTKIIITSIYMDKEEDIPIQMLNNTKFSIIQKKLLSTKHTVIK